MSAFSSTQISKPTDEQAFERACLALFRCLINDPISNSTVSVATPKTASISSGFVTKTRRSLLEFNAS